jgi:2-polyprenyl-3-methyl-5-hydroxy-6-metoxy-1,4-benzoquinol methylase
VATEQVPRFEFGRNWQRFLNDVDEVRVQIAERSLSEMLGLPSLEGRSFLDVGSGSGLFSLAAVRLGASRVHSFDFDRASVDATATLRKRYAPECAWTVEQGDATDTAYCASLGEFDVVYAWGVLHHTGAMWKALENVSARVAADGYLFVSIYNDQGRSSDRWRAPSSKCTTAYPRLFKCPMRLS